MNAGLDWRLTPSAGYQIALDAFLFQNGTRSLRVTFDGTVNPNFEGISQTIPVDPNRRYRFQAYLRADGITSDNGPFFRIGSRGAPPEETFTVTTPPRVQTMGWVREQLDFQTGPRTSLVIIQLRRLPSQKLNNLIQGKVWIDNLSVKPLSGRFPLAACCLDCFSRRVLAYLSAFFHQLRVPKLAVPTTALRKTALNETHRRLGARMVEFGGWDMPVEYSGIVPEHMAVRTRVGLFDVSHMGEVEVRGQGALPLLQNLTCNDVSRLRIGQAQYSGLMNERGGMVDDLLVHRLGEQDYLLCVNASRREADYDWIASHNQPGAHGAAVRNSSDEYSQLAVQGPAASPFSSRSLRSSSRRSSITGSAAERSAARTPSSPAPATPARTASKSISRSRNPSASGTPFSKPGSPRGLCPAAWARAIRCGSRPECCSMGTTWMRTPRRSR